MDDPLLVRHRQRREDLDHHVDELVHRELRLAQEALGQRLAEELLHHQVGAPVVELTHVVDLADVRVPERARDPRLVLEARHRVALLRALRVQHLDRDQPTDGQVLGLVDLPHPAFADERLHAVAIADDPPDQAAIARGQQRGGALQHAAIQPGRARSPSTSRRLAWDWRGGPRRLGRRRRAHRRARRPRRRPGADDRRGCPPGIRGLGGIYRGRRWSVGQVAPVAGHYRTDNSWSIPQCLQRPSVTRSWVRLAIRLAAATQKRERTPYVVRATSRNLGRTVEQPWDLPWRTSPPSGRR